MITVRLLERERDEDATPGPWWRPLRVRDSKDAPPRKSAWIKCPNGHVATLQDHTISPDGTVNPSVQCYESDCSFHETVKLDGWSP